MCFHQPWHRKKAAESFSIIFHCVHRHPTNASLLLKQLTKTTSPTANLCELGTEQNSKREIMSRRPNVACWYTYNKRIRESLSTHSPCPKVRILNGEKNGHWLTDRSRVWCIYHFSRLRGNTWERSPDHVSRGIIWSPLLMESQHRGEQLWGLH